MGLKQDVSNALGTPSTKAAGATPSTTPAAPEKPAPVEVQPVQISGDAIRALNKKIREWSGWSDATLVFGTPSASPFADVDHTTRTFTFHESLILNPHRVLNTVTPFRLRQEAVLTGCMLHEAGHARHSHWLPRTAEQARVTPARHSDGAVPTKAIIALARMMEEPRIEGLQARDAAKIGAAGLDWTMRASAAHLIPTTVLTITDANQKIMDLITSWALRAGRQIAVFAHDNSHTPRDWVQDFTTLLHMTLVKHMSERDDGGLGVLGDAHADTKHVMDLLIAMLRCEDDKGSTMIDHARDVLALLFPETDADDMPQPNSGCEFDECTLDAEAEAGEEGGESAEQESGGAEGQPEDEEPGDGSEDSEGGEDEDGASDSTEPSEADEELAAELAEMEARSKFDAKGEAKDEEAKTPPMETGGLSGGAGGEGNRGGGWRAPTKEERNIQKGAERFLRDLISPTETSVVSLSESPSATVDAAALAAWKADGGTREPRFFKRTRREVESSPPVKVAILVDVSSSMNELQKPSALLSWALASAALDLRNFAGRGQQLESTLIHWGNDARVIQKNGQTLPGIREVPCAEGTSAMAEALDLVEEQMPGFFDIGERPEHRLLVQFTDWQLFGARHSGPRISQAMAAGVNMVTVAPHDYTDRGSNLPEILRGCVIQRGTSKVLRYNAKHPEQVWDEAARALL